MRAAMREERWCAFWRWRLGLEIEAHSQLGTTRRIGTGDLGEVGAALNGIDVGAVGVVQRVERRNGDADRRTAVELLRMQFEIVAPAKIKVGVVGADFRVARNAVGTRVEKIVSVSVSTGEDGPGAAAVGEDPDAEVEHVLGVEHCVDAEVLALIPVSGTPVGVGVLLLLREPPYAAGVVAVVAEAIPG